MPLARALIGCRVVHVVSAARGAEFVEDLRVARIVETEAYRGPTDLACHARAGRTRRTQALFGPEGHAYVFLVYGMHECFNVTCLGEGTGHAVLVRGAEPVAGFPLGTRLDGPGRFSRGMGIDRALDGADLTAERIFLCRRAGSVRIAVSARVGVSYAGTWADKPWRFFDPTSSHVSRPPRRSLGRSPA